MFMPRMSSAYPPMPRQNHTHAADAELRQVGTHGNARSFIYVAPAQPMLEDEATLLTERGDALRAASIPSCYQAGFTMNGDEPIVVVLGCTYGFVYNLF